MCAAMVQTSFSEEPTLTFGLRAGAGMSFAQSTNTLSKLIIKQDISPGLSYYAGGFVNIPLNTTWSIQPEIHFITETAKRSETDTNSWMITTESGQIIGTLNNYTVTSNYTLTSLRVPVLLICRFGEEKNGKLNIFIGPNFGYILSGKVTDEFTDSTGKPVILFSGNVLPGYTVHIRDINRFQFGFTIGGSFPITDNIIVDARFNYNLTKSFEESRFAARISNVVIGIGYIF